MMWDIFTEDVTSFMNLLDQDLQNESKLTAWKNLRDWNHLLPVIISQGEAKTWGANPDRVNFLAQRCDLFHLHFYVFYFVLLIIYQVNLTINSQLIFTFRQISHLPGKNANVLPASSLPITALAALTSPCMLSWQSVYPQLVIIQNISVFK